MKQHNFIAILLFLILSVYLVLSFSNYSLTRIKRNMKYHLDDHTYTVPDLPIYGNGFLLSHDFRKTQRELLITVFAIAEKANINIWLSGGTLLGFIRHGTIMPWDDDIDVHTSFDNLYYLFGSEFQSVCDSMNCEAIKLKLFTHSYATRISAGIRIRFKNSTLPCCDVFFTHTNNKQVKKVDGWSTTKIVYNEKEQFSIDDIYPLQKKQIDGINVVIPHHPMNVLQNQYGASVMDKIYITSPFMSHAVPFNFSYAWCKADTDAIF